MPQPPPLSDRELARLLSGRQGPSVLDKEALFERVDAELHSAKAGARWKRWLAVGGVGGLAVAAASWLLMPGALPQLTARGGVSGPTLRIVCVDTGRLGACPQGGRLAFELQAGAFQHFGAFARRQDGLIIWYFPERDGTSPPLSGNGPAPALRGGAPSNGPAPALRGGAPLQINPTVLPRAVRIGDNQPPGEYEIFVVFSHRPLTRDSIRAGLDDAFKPRDELFVMHQSLRIEAAR